MWWKTDITLLARQLLPPVLRSKVMTALLRVLTLPLRRQMVFLDDLHTDSAERLNTTASVISMERALNGAFFLQDRQIWIDSGTQDNPPYWHTRAEQQAKRYMYAATEGKTAALKLRGEADYGTSFVVWVPTFLCTSTDAAEDKYKGVNLNAIEHITRYYKPAGRTFRIELYDYE